MKFYKIYIPIILFLITSLLNSCVREDVIPFKSGNTHSKLVIYSFLAPGDSVFIYVGKTQPFGQANYNNSDFKELDATVTLSATNGRSIQLKLIENKEPVYACSQKEFAIVKGETYNLLVAAENKPTVTATTTVPLNPAIWLNAHITDYRFIGSWKKVSSTIPTGYSVNLVDEQNHSTINTTEGISVIGDEYTVKREVYFEENTLKLKAVLITGDKNYSDFNQMNNLTYNITENFSTSSFLDIISGYKGVIPEAGNIVNGVGVFGSYLTDVKTVYK